MTRSGLAVFLPRFFGVGLDVIGDALDQRVRQALFDRAAAPGIFFDLRLSLLPSPSRRTPAGARSQSGRRFSSTSSTSSQQVLGNLFVDRELAGVHDAHVHAARNRVIEKRGVHRFAHDIVAAEGKRNVAHAAADFGVAAAWP